MKVDAVTYAHLREIAWSDERRHLDLVKSLIARPYNDWQPNTVITRKLRRVTGHLQPRWTGTLPPFDEEATQTMPTERIEI